MTLLHRLGMVRTRLIIDDAFGAAGLQPPEWIFEQDTNPGTEPSDAATKKFVLYERFAGRPHPVVCKPDASFLAQLPAKKLWHLVGYLEYDRSTVKNEQIAGKLAGYAALLSKQRYRRHWPNLPEERYIVRIVFVCPSTERVDSIRQVVAGSSVAQYLRFGVEPELLEADCPLTEPVWQDVSGARFPILKALPGRASGNP